MRTYKHPGNDVRAAIKKLKYKHPTALLSLKYVMGILNMWEDLQSQMETEREVQWALDEG